MKRRFLPVLLSVALAAGPCFPPEMTVEVMAGTAAVQDVASQIAVEDMEMEQQLNNEKEEPSAEEFEFILEEEPQPEEETPEEPQPEQDATQVFTAGGEPEAEDQFSEPAAGFSGEDLFTDDGGQAFSAQDFDDGEEQAFSAGTEAGGSQDSDLDPNASEVTLQVENIGGKTEDITGKLNSLLLKVKDRAKDDSPVKVIIPPGSYEITGTICMYSNIYLYAVGATIKKTSPGKHLVLRLGNTRESAGGYDGYRNVTIEGGTWDLNYPSVQDKEGAGGFVGFCIGHARNVVIKNATFLNNLKSHFIEFGGVQNARVTGCTFRGYWKGYELGGQESIQLDPCIGQDGVFPQYEPFDGTVCSDITVTGNTFEDVFAGVGSHSMVYDRPVKNVVISNNTFRNIKKRAVWCLNYQNARVENNDMINVGGGVYIRSMYSDNTYLAPGQGAANGGNQQAGNVTVQNNRISTSESGVIGGGNWQSFGIHINGELLKTPKKGIPGQAYTLKQVYIRNNTITGSGNGIRLLMARQCEVSGNSLSLRRNAKISNRGIYLGAASDNVITKNTVKNPQSAGIYVYNGGSLYKTASQRNNITYNNVSACAGNGVQLDALSSETSVHSNTVSGNTGKGIYVYDSPKSRITYNNVRGNKNAGIMLDGASNSVTVKRNNVSTSRGHGIYILSSKSCVVCYNTSTANARDGIALNKCKGGTTKVYSNTAGGNKKRGISVYGSTVANLSKNTVENNKSHGIFASGATFKTQRYNDMKGNGTTYAICTKKCKGIANLKKVQSSKVTKKTTVLKGTAAGGKTVTAYVKKGSKKTKLKRGRVTSKGKYSLRISKKQKKNTVLVFVSKDKYGNTVTTEYKVK